MKAPLQLPMFPPRSEWTLPDLSALPSWADAKRIAIDLETSDPLLTKMGPGVRRGGFVAGVAFAIEDGPAAYLPIGHGNGTNLSPEKVLAYLRQQAKTFSGDIVGSNFHYDLDYLLELGIDFRPRYFRDIQIAEPLLDELQDTYNLDDVAARWGLPGKDRTLLNEAARSYGVDPSTDLWKLPPEYVGVYAERDVRLPLDLLRRQEQKIDDEDLWNIYNLESQLLPVLVRMRRRGVAISYDQLDRVERWSVEKETELLGKIADGSGQRIAVGDTMKPEECARVIRALGIPVPTTAKTGQSSITKEFLASIKHPVAALLAEARRVFKVRSTFVESVRAHATKGRIHCTLKQLRGSSDNDDENDSGARYGRLASRDPNLQQQPARDPEIGPMWRSVYVADPGTEWACLDYSQQEPRWLTHYAELAQCGGAKEAGDRYRNDPKTDNHTMMAELTGLPRRQAKDLFLGKCYGMGGAKLCRSLGLPTEWIERRGGGGMIEVAGPEGAAIIQQFDARCPYVRQLAGMVEAKAQRVGFIITVLGRRCRFPKVGGGYDWTHKALNRLIQGSSADQTKKAMVEADAAGILLQLQVHDELDLSIASRSEAERLATIMKDCVPSLVPSKVDIEIGPSWGQLEKTSG